MKTIHISYLDLKEMPFMFEKQLNIFSVTFFSSKLACMRPIDPDNSFFPCEITKSD
jgi:hypothetical protein